jgi:hypothetical protein
VDRVYVAFTVPDHEGLVLQGVYSTRARAEEALASIDTEADRFPPHVEERTLDEPPRPSTY